MDILDESNGAIPTFTQAERPSKKEHPKSHDQLGI
jgi:hypothetical protein